jgi:HK97 family phage major capsid protein
VQEIPLGPNTNSTKIPAVDERSRQDGYRWGGVQAFWEDEAQSLVGSKLGFNLIELYLKKLTGLFYATNEVLEDAAQLGTLAMKAFPEEFAFKMDDGIINGTGAGQLSGILNSNALITVAKSSNQAAATITYGNIKAMYARLWARSRPNAVWLVNQDVEPQLEGLAQEIGTGGIPVYQPVGSGLWNSGAEPPIINNVELNQVAGKLKGRPVVVVEQCQTLGTVGDIILFDPTQYLMATKGGIQTAVSMHVRFITDEQTFRWILRRDGQLWWKASVTPAHGGNSFSPAVALATRS